MPVISSPSEEIYEKGLPLEELQWSAERLKQLKSQLKVLEVSRSITFKRVVIGYIVAIISIPFWGVGYTLAGKFGILTLLSPVLTPLGKFFSQIVAKRRSRKLVVSLIAFLVTSPYLFFATRISKRYFNVVIPSVFNQLAIPYKSPGNVSIKLFKKIFKEDISVLHNPLTAYGFIGATPFEVHILELKYAKSSIFSNYPDLINLFDGICIHIKLLHSAPTSLLLTFEQSKLTNKKWNALPLPCEKTENTFNAYTRHEVHEAHKLLKPEFLHDLLECNGSFNDLPTMELIIQDNNMFVFVPTTIIDYLPTARFNINLTNLEPIHKMLQGWQVLWTNINLLEKYYPELLHTAPQPSPHPQSNL